MSGTRPRTLGIPRKKTPFKSRWTTEAWISVLDYSVPIDLSVYQFTLQFHPHADNHTI